MHPYLSHQLAELHRNDILREAEIRRLAHQTDRSRRLIRLALFSRLRGIFNTSVRRNAERLDVSRRALAPGAF